MKKIKPRKIMNRDHYFMFLCKMVAEASKDPSTQVGAILIDDENRIVGAGYNGMPKGCDDDKLPWDRGKTLSDSKYLFICHAESNAIDFSDPLRLNGSRLYCSLHPCNECAKKIIQNGIKEVIYLDDKYANTDEVKAAKIMFQMAGIRTRKFVPKIKSLTLEL